uniref:Uncharacterized protein n=1 Tax=Chenopodium quinoa TaxID=63459 RepID=A0A803MT14_CHEQI
MSWIAWEKLHFSKNEGGLGVRDFQAFNKALLAKQAWRVFTNAQFLMSKVLEGKYFPSINFLEARLNYNASFTWKSICAARNLVLKRARKVVGSGGSINIWKDPWVSGLPNFKVWSRREVDSEDSLQIVYELIESGIWKREIVDALFAEQEASAIKNIPLPAHSCEDVWMWHHTKLGFFLVKSAYYIELKDSRAPVVSSSENRHPCPAGGRRPKLWPPVYHPNNHLPPELHLAIATSTSVTPEKPYNHPQKPNLILENSKP